MEDLVDHKGPKVHVEAPGDTIMEKIHTDVDSIKHVDDNSETKITVKSLL